LLATIRARSNEAEVAEAAIIFGAKDDRKSSFQSGKKMDEVGVEAASSRLREVGSLLAFALSVGSRCSLRDQKSYLDVIFVNEASPLIDLNRSHDRSVVNS
jgi:hypothetical protein